MIINNINTYFNSNNMNGTTTNNSNNNNMRITSDLENGVIKQIIENASNVFKKLLITNNSNNSVQFKLDLKITEYDDGEIKYEVNIKNNQQNDIDIQLPQIAR